MQVGDKGDAEALEGGRHVAMREVVRLNAADALIGRATWVVFDVILVPRCTITFCTGAVFFICCFFTSPFAGWRRTLRKSDWSKVNIGERRAGNPIVSPSCVLSACMTDCGNDTVIIRLERQEDKSSRERMDM